MSACRPTHSGQIQPDSTTPLTTYADHLKNTIQKNLSRFEVRRAESEDQLTHAAVAVVIEPAGDNSSACMYLTLRSSKLRKHAGQYALPGGKLDLGESIQQAALRELSEELGITLNNDSLLGALDDFVTRSGFIISPLLLWNDTGIEPIPNEAEVARFYRVPLTDLLDDNLVDQEYSAASPVFSISPGSVGTSIYSPTAAIIFQFREVALLGRATRVSHYEQPGFAWR